MQRMQAVLLVNEEVAGIVLGWRSDSTQNPAWAPQSFPRGVVNWDLMRPPR
jgi:hypothetical protein